MQLSKRRFTLVRIPLLRVKQIFYDKGFDVAMPVSVRRSTLQLSLERRLPGRPQVTVTRQTLGNGSAVLRPDGSYADGNMYLNVVVILTVSPSAERPARAEGFMGGMSSNFRRSL